MKVLLYNGGRQLVKESGVGRALSHQEQALSYGNVDFTENPKDDYDVVHINTVLPDAWAMAVKAQKEGKKVVYHGHSTREDFRNSFIGSNTFAPLFGRWLCSCYGKADLVLTPSEYSRKLLTGYGLKVPVAAVSNGIDIDFFRKEEGQRKQFRQKYSCSENEKIVLTVGLPIERKGILDFLKLAEQMPQYRFFWCGHAAKGLIPGKIRKAMKEAPENVRFLGYLNREQLRDAYGGSDLFFFPTKEETEGIVMLEALSMEIPVLVRDIPVYQDWLENGVQVWKEKDRKGFAKKIPEILEGKAPDLTKNGRKTAEERSLRMIGKTLAGLYESLYTGEREK